MSRSNFGGESKEQATRNKNQGGIRCITLLFMMLLRPRIFSWNNTRPIPALLFMMLLRPLAEQNFSKCCGHICITFKILCARAN
jgi:hypothetical protein